MAKEKKGVRLEHISKIYEDPKSKKKFYAVKDLSVNIKPGSFVTLLGPSGCGKTTTLRMVAGFESPDEGEIYLGEEKINELPPNKRDTAMVFQSYALLPHYNVYDNVAYGLKIRHIPKDEINKRVLDILKLVQLDGMEDRMTNQLSGGQQQRVALARALVVEPGVLLFDEPLSNRVAKLRVAMRTEIRRIQQTAGITAIYVTHDHAEAMAISDQIIIMNKGVVAQIGTPTEIYYQPKNEFVADFIGEVNFLDGKVVKKKKEDIITEVYGVKIPVKTGEGEVGDDVRLVLRPECLHLKDDGDLKGKVVVSTFMGAYQLYHVMVNDTLVKITEYNPKGKKIYKIDDTVALDFSSTDVHIIPKKNSELKTDFIVPVQEKKGFNFFKKK